MIKCIIDYGEFIPSSLWLPTRLNWENPDDLAEKKLSSHQFCSSSIRLADTGQDREMKILFGLVADLLVCMWEVGSKLTKAESTALICSNCFPKSEALWGAGYYPQVIFLVCSLSCVSLAPFPAEQLSGLNGLKPVGSARN